MVIDDAIDVAAGAGEKIIDTNEVGAVFKQTLAQVRAEKTGAAGHNHTRFEMHKQQPPRDQSPLRAYGSSLSITARPPGHTTPSRRLVAIICASEWTLSVRRRLCRCEEDGDSSVAGQ